MNPDDVEIEIRGDRLLARASPSEDVHVLVSAPAVPSADVESALDGLASAIDARAWSMSPSASRTTESALARDIRRASERVRERESERQRERRREAASERQRASTDQHSRPDMRESERASAPSRAVETDGGSDR